MKKVILLILLFILSIQNVSAKDTVFSINKYAEENLTIIKDSYNSEQKKDGYLVAGTIVKDKKTEEENKEFILTKYKKNGNISWIYQYENNINETSMNLNYFYNEEELIGYLVELEILNEENISKSIFLIIDLDGNLLEEKETNLEGNEIIQEIINIQQDGYIAISNIIDNNIVKKSRLIRYNKDLEIIWIKEEIEAKYKKIIELSEEGYLILREKQTEDKTSLLDIIKVDKEGNNIEVKQTNLEKYQSLSLLSLEDAYIIYGLTPEVKLKNGQYSYFINKYNNNGEELWELIGDDPVKDKNLIQLNFIDNKLLLSYKNASDNSYEVVKVTDDGVIEKKVKKIHNDYYKLNYFLSNKNTLYFVGQINCPEDDNCDFDNNSLFLISDEDKVIEVKEKDNNNILISFGILLLMIMGMLIIKKRRRLN